MMFYQMSLEATAVAILVYDPPAEPLLYSTVQACKQTQIFTTPDILKLLLMQFFCNVNCGIAVLFSLMYYILKPTADY